MTIHKLEKVIGVIVRIWVYELEMRKREVVSKWECREHTFTPYSVRTSAIRVRLRPTVRVVSLCKDKFLVNP